MDVSFSRPPAMFGPFHLGMLAGIALVCVLVFLIIRRWRERALLRLIFILGVGMVLMEVWKQWFVWNYVYVHERNLWFFPWQLCSMAMYCCLLLPYLKRKHQDAVLVFLATFSLLAALMALAVPADMLRPQILLTLHGFIYHGLMLVESLTAAIIIGKRGKASFTPAVMLFIIMAAIAEMINVAGHYLMHDIHREPDMFFITPYYPTTQPFFDRIAASLGILPEILLYLLATITASWLLYLIGRGTGSEKRQSTDQRLS